MKTKILKALALANLLTLCSVMPTSLALAADAPKTIAVSVKRFAYEPSKINLKKGQPVVLEITTEDVAHGLKFKELNLNTKIEKDKPGELSFTPMQTGDFVGHCSVFCGSGHGSMTLTLHVTE
ncbi:cupredoxin domain-containing protein [Granulicella sp. S190]|uniref:cupredoxin domain-containing protein n=1 Tax=Granulicella sp. S190 TaxID=1747226 RepID=UPI00131B9F8F|nr:cupredoxin domain-containing protein [Granulicella sp. S190]